MVYNIEAHLSIYSRLADPRVLRGGATLRSAVQILIENYTLHIIKKYIYFL